MIVLGFLAGIGAVKGIMEIAGRATVQKEFVASLQSKIVEKEKTLEAKAKEIEKLEQSLAAQKANTAKQHWINVSEIEGTNENGVRAVIKVNGTSYSYPTPAVWAALPGRIAENFPLPSASSGYLVSFDIISRSGKRYTNAKPIRVKQLPYKGVFEAYAEKIVETGGNFPGSTWPSAQHKVVSSVVRIHFEIE